MTTPGPVRRTVAAITIGSFSLAALLGVLALLGGGDFGEGQARVLLTTVVVGATSVAVLCYLVTAATDYEAVGVAGGVSVLVPLLTSLVLIWGEDPFGGDGVWQTFGIGVVLATLLAQACLLLVLTQGRDRLRPLLVATLALAGVLAVLVCSAILGADDDGLWRLIGIVAILDVLGTVVAMALGAFAPAADAPPPPAGVGQEPAHTVRVPARLDSELATLARRTGRTSEDLVAEALTRYLAVGDPDRQSGT
ncbi:hypothetical protein [Nocardioides sp.]|uniref:hypothetical protein n=1 Tax=Nocardioides sp. TaxID=35761 RepID=UPI003219A61E